MITKTIAAGIIAVTTLASVPASAGGLTVEFGLGDAGYGWNGHDRGDRGGRHHNRMHRLSTDEIRWMLRDRGYHGIRFVDDNGPVYQLQARKYGRMFFLVVSARDGEILSRQRI
jgi:hypothetical protein